MDEEDLRELAHAAVRQGKLPARRPDRTLGGPGGGAHCAVCGEAVKSHQMEIELQFARDINTPDAGLDRYHVHIRCFAVWELARATS
jgi:hypothetical protein